MSVLVQEIYDQTCFILNEDAGFVLGVFSPGDFLNTLALVYSDFSQRTALDKSVYTQRILMSVSQYTVPDNIQRPDLCFIGGRVIEQVSEADLTQGSFEWKLKLDIPRQWHEDNLAPKTIEVSPTPNYNGTVMTSAYGEFDPLQRNLTIIGPSLPDQTDWTLDDTLDIPSSFGPYLVYGVLEQVFDAEGETRDAQRAAYCHTRFEECIGLANAICREEILEGDDD